MVTRILTIVFAVLVGSMQGFASCAQTAIATPQRSSYLKNLLFHPDLTQSPQPVFQAYSETTSADSNKHFVLYSISTPGTSPSSDATFSVFLAVLTGKTGSDTLTSQLDVTHYAFVSPEDTGVFFRMDGCLNAFLAPPPPQTASATQPSAPPPPGPQIVHMNLWGVMSGSGALSDGSDVFFKLGSALQLTPVLVLSDTSEHRQTGIGSSVSIDSTIVAVSDANGYISEIWLQQRIFDAEQSPPQFSQESTKYAWSGSDYQVVDDVTADSFAAVTAAGRTLVRSDQIPSVTPPS